MLLQKAGIDMVMHDLNPEKKEVVLMIHPMLSSAEGFQVCLTPYLGDVYRYLLPDLNGHGDAVKRTYVSAEAEAKEIHEYLVEHDCCSIQFGYCASLGACVMFKLLQYSDLSFEHVFFEGASLYGNAPILNWLVTTVFLSKHKKAVKDPALSARKMTALYGEIAGEAMAQRFIAVNEESIRNICYDCSHVDMIPLSEEMQAKCVFAYGEKDSDLKNARKQQPKHYPKAELKVWPGFGHCARISKDSEAYSEMLKQYL